MKEDDECEMREELPWIRTRVKDERECAAGTLR